MLWHHAQRWRRSGGIAAAAHAGRDRAATKPHHDISSRLFDGTKNTGIMLSYQTVAATAQILD
jgi:hypothetical protein